MSTSITSISHDGLDRFSRADQMRAKPREGSAVANISAALEKHAARPEVSTPGRPAPAEPYPKIFTNKLDTQGEPRAGSVVANIHDTRKVAVKEAPGQESSPKEGTSGWEAFA